MLYSSQNCQIGLIGETLGKIKHCEEMRVSLLECCYFEIRDNILLFKNITSLEDGSFDGVSAPSESNRKDRKQRRNEIFVEQ